MPWIVANTETHNCSSTKTGLMSHLWHAQPWMRQVYHSPLLDSGNILEEETEGSISQRSRRSRTKYYLLDKTWLLHSCDCLHNLYTSQVSPQSNTVWETDSWASALTEEFLTVDGFWGKAIHFLLRAWLLVSWICSSGCTHTENSVCSINWRKWVIKFF